MKFKEMEKNKENKAVVLLWKITERSTKNKKVYCDVEFSDGDEIITAKVWNYSRECLLRGAEEKSIVEGFFVPELYNGRVSYVANRYFVYQGDEYCMDDFAVTAFVDEDEIFKRCMDATDPESVYGKITRKILTDHKELFLTTAASQITHHACKKGLAWHTGNVLSLGEKLADSFPLINRDLFFAGIVLHDMGKIKEISTDYIGETVYTEEGELCGHLYAGAEMVEIAAREIFPDTDPYRREINLLKHMILSHHGKKECGSPQEPKIVEAMLLWHLDRMETGYNIYEQEYGKLETGEFSDRKPALGDIHLMKHE